MSKKAKLEAVPSESASVEEMLEKAPVKVEPKTEAVIDGNTYRYFAGSVFKVTGNTQKIVGDPDKIELVKKALES